MKQKKWLYLFISFLFCLIFGGTVLADQKEHSLQFFYENVCASCHEDEKFYDLFNRCITPEEKAGITYEIRTYNTFLESDGAAYEEILQEAGKTRGEVTLPVLVIDGQWLSGYDKIEAELHKILLEGKIVEESAEVVETEKTTAEQKAEIVIEAGDQEKAVLLFSTYACKDCEAVKEYLAGLGRERDFVLKEYSIAEGTHVQLFKEVLKLFGEDPEKGKVPSVFVGETALIGKEEILAKLKEVLDTEESRCGVLKEKLSGLAGEKERVEAASLATIFGAGLLSGFNPCSISMLLMLFSILLTSQASVLKNGAIYLAAKYLTYLGIGAAICFAASLVDQQFLDRFGNGIDFVMAGLFLAVAVMNFLDFLNVRRDDYGKIRMQLPAGLRRWNHQLLKRAEHLEGAVLGFVVLGLGAAVSLGEFFCTGQIYMASIVYLLRNAREQILPIMGTLLVYVTAMSIPAMAILFVIHKTKGTGRVSDFMLKHMGAIKLLNSVLFVLYACYFLFF